MSDLPAIAIPLGLELARLGIDAAEGRVSSAGDVARRLLGIGVQIVPHEELSAYLTELGITLAEAAANQAEAAKFPGGKGKP